jgi:putative Ca2+/H+ antiporter (TMEM165/GDT1 family)
MDKRLFLTVFASVFLAEIGDKTQLATMAFASSSTSKWTVFAASATALVLAAGIGVLGGELVSRVVSPRVLSTAAGVAFLLIGAWMIWRASHAPA